MYVCACIFSFEERRSRVPSLFCNIVCQQVKRITKESHRIKAVWKCFHYPVYIVIESDCRTSMILDPKCYIVYAVTRVYQYEFMWYLSDVSQCLVWHMLRYCQVYCSTFLLDKIKKEVGGGDIIMAAYFWISFTGASACHKLLRKTRRSLLPTDQYCLLGLWKSTVQSVLSVFITWTVAEPLFLFYPPVSTKKYTV